MTETTHSARPHVVVVGGGFAGINSAHALAHSDADGTLVDRHQYQTFQPLLYQVSSDYLPAEEDGAAFRSVFRRQANLTVRIAVSVSIDRSDRKLGPEDGSTLEYDYVILAAGVETSSFDIAAIIPLKQRALDPSNDRLGWLGLTMRRRRSGVA